MIQRAARLMAAYHGAKEFPTSLDLTADRVEGALRAMLTHLAGLPRGTWELD